MLFTAHDSFGLSEGDGGTDLSGLGGPVVGRLHARTAAAAARPPAVTSAERRDVAASAAGGQLAATVRDMRRYPLTLAFLLAYLVYNDGIQTVISQASVYGSEELGLDQSTLIGAVLLVQVLAVAGALRHGPAGAARTARSARSSARWWRGR